MTFGKNNIIDRFRYWALKKLAGNMPVVLNMNVARWDDEDDNACLIYMLGNKTGLINGCHFYNRPFKYVLSARRDVKI